MSIKEIAKAKGLSEEYVRNNIREFLDEVD